MLFFFYNIVINIPQNDHFVKLRGTLKMADIFRLAAISGGLVRLSEV